jgi:hypothetical protein
MSKLNQPALQKGGLGEGTAKVTISGDILDSDCNNPGDLHETALEAIEVWGSVLRDFGVKLATPHDTLSPYVQ